MSADSCLDVLQRSVNAVSMIDLYSVLRNWQFLTDAICFRSAKRKRASIRHCRAVKPQPALSDRALRCFSVRVAMGFYGAPDKMEQGI
ncbi:hypothetical protein ACQ4M3_28550 [Leptolyngbya sp. AN03gr2]|uniref:hypothetical protein n=1 Tax=unclassified Leptolyngbya TaxID=2650499 RepID=UPI003D311F96